MSEKPIFYTGLIAQVASQDKFLEFMDGMTVAYPVDYAMLQGAVGNSHAPNSGIRVSISSHSEGSANAHVSALVPTYVFDQIKQVCISNLGSTDVRGDELVSAVNGIGRIYLGLNILLKEAKNAMAGAVTGNADSGTLTLALGKAIKKALLKLNGVTEDKTKDDSVPLYKKLSINSQSDYKYSQVRVKNSKGGADAHVPCNTLSIKRAAFITDSQGKEVEMRQPWSVCISKFEAKPKVHSNGTVSYDAASVRNKQSLSFMLSDDDMYRVAYSVEHFVAQWERAHLSEFMDGEAQTKFAKGEFFKNNG